MNNRQLKKMAAKKHNQAYLESLKPRPAKQHNPISRDARLKAQTLMAIQLAAIS